MTYFVRVALKLLVGSFIIVFLFILGSNVWVVYSTEDKILTDYKNLPDSSVVLVLGTSNKLSNGLPNPYFEERIKAAATLYTQGKAIHFLLSGDNRSRYYNEPEEMRKSLIKAGVPERMITLDYAGLRTLDSIVRSKEIFGQNRLIIVTQPFHCYRALFISRYYNIDAVALLSDSDSENAIVRVNIREWLARSKAVLDLYILKTTPHHLGESEPLELK